METGERVGFWRHEPDATRRLRAFLEQPEATFIGFNNRSFDDVVATAFCSGKTEQEIKTIANDIIVNRLPSCQAVRKHRLQPLNFDSIDLIEVAPSFVGLKAYGSRLHMPLIQDMPLAHDKEIHTPEQERMVESYCDNDVDTTEALLKKLEKEMLLRVSMSKLYGVDMRSKSDSQMAEQAYISSMGLRRRENRIPDTIRYAPPAYLKFQTPALQELLERVTETVFAMNPATGHVRLPDFLGKEVICFGSGTYQLGIGGIHSTHDKSVCHTASADYVITDIDAESFYPSLILLCNMYPESVGPAFISEYRKIYDKRIEAKHTGDKATNETLKISLNGTFGKLASRYSVLYAPELMLATTLTGQFTLLMLIEWLEHVGAVTLSANTDGIAVGFTKSLQPAVDEVVAKFSERTGLKFEFTPYRVLAMKDVNNYLAVKPDRKIKEKGIYAPLSLKKNPTAGVCAIAVGQWLAYGTPFLETIKNAGFQDFLSARNVTGGGTQNGEYLGKVVRWYQSTDRTLEPLKYASNGNKVPKTEGARACMQIDLAAGHPADLDYDWYLREAIKIAVLLGCERYLPAEQLELIAEPQKQKRKRKNETA